MKNKKAVCGIPFDDLSKGELVRKIFLLSEEKAVTVVTPNAEICRYALKNPYFMKLLCSADVSVPDGEGVIIASRLVGSRIKSGKTAGVELGLSVAEKCAELGLSLFIFGGKPSVAELAAEKLKSRFPKLVIAGSLDGYSSPDTAGKAVSESRADVVFVCLGSPLQEKWVSENKNCGAKILIALGGSVDIYAGTAKRAPHFMIRAKLEWLYRLIKQPKRFVRMLSIPAFLLEALESRISGHRPAPRQKPFEKSVLEDYINYHGD